MGQFNVELWGILDGLKLIQRNQNNFIIQSDNLKVVKAIHGSDSSTSNSALIKRIQNILAQNKQSLLHYIPREQNKVTDCLAKLALVKEYFDVIS